MHSSNPSTSLLQIADEYSTRSKSKTFQLLKADMKQASSRHGCPSLGTASSSLCFREGTEETQSPSWASHHTVAPSVCSGWGGGGGCYVH